MAVVIEWTVGDRMGKARRVAAISTPDMCEYLGIHRNSLNAYEHDRSRPPLAVLRLWAMRCGVELDWLRYGDGPAAKPKGKVARSSTKWYSAVLRTVVPVAA